MESPNLGKYVRYLSNNRPKVDFDFSKPEAEYIKSMIYLTDLQKDILDGLLNGYGRDKISMVVHKSVPTIDREIKKIVQKIINII